MGWLIALGIMALIAFMPVGALVQYDSGGFLVRIIAGYFRFTLYPMKKRKKKPEKETKAVDTSPKKPKEKKVSQPQSAAPSDGDPKGGSLQDFLPFARLGLDFVNQFRKKMRVNYLRLKLILAGEDPCDLAVNYGRAWAAMGNLLPMLERGFHIGKRDCEVECDFTAQQTLVIAQAEMTLRIWQAATLMSVYGFGFLKELLILKKKRKGGGVS